MVPDILSRWAYPASEAYRNISIHGSAEDDKEMKELIQEEEERQRQCMWLRLSNCETQILPVQTRKKCAEKEKGDRQEVGGTETLMPPPQSLSTEKKRKRVRFQEPGHIGATEEPEDNILESSADKQRGDQRGASEPSGKAQIFMQDIWLVE